MSDDLSIPSPGYRGRRRPTGGLEPGTKLALIVAGVLGGTLVIGFLASGLMHRGSGSVPVVQADSRPIRVKPDNPGGLQVDSANNEIFSGGSDTDGSKLAPAPETPDPKAMRAVPPPETAPATVAQVAPAVPKAATPLRPVAESPAAKPAPVVTTAKPAKGAVVQLAALTSEDAAKAEWHQLEKRMPQLLGGHQPSFSRTERNGRTYWRLRTTGFADGAQARTFCEQVRTKGGACSVADF